ncbi:MAG: class II glutamine amidotransferase [Francisellaceae bacterium]
MQQSRLATESTLTLNGDGFGIGWYHPTLNKTPGTYKDAQPAWNNENLKSIASHVRSPLFFAHIRATTGTPSSELNCHPFRYNEWLFMHNGAIGGFDKIRYDLEHMIDRKYYNHKLGCTDTEVLFLLALSLGLEKNPAEALKASIDCCETLILKHQIQDCFRGTIALSNGFCSYVLRYSAKPEKSPSLYYVYGEDVRDIIEQDEHSLDDFSQAIIVLSEPVSSHDKYVKIDNGECLRIEGGKATKMKLWE